MKKFIYPLILLFALSFIACEKETVIIPDKDEDIETPQFKVDPNATILIRPAKTVDTRAMISDLTNLEIVQNAINIKFETQWFANSYSEDSHTAARTFIPEHKDFENETLKMWGIDIINAEGEYQRGFIYGFNIVITDGQNDTIAYIPDAVIDDARIEIEKAYNDGDHEKVYNLFNTAFTFLPIESK